MYYNELELLKYRIATCYEHVNFFIIVQASEQHLTSKTVKKLNINDIDSKYHDKIIIEYIDFPKEYTLNGISIEKEIRKIAWKREYYNRNYIKVILNKMASDDDLCVISDADEICNYKVLMKYLDKFNLFDKISHHILLTFAFNIHYFQSNYAVAPTFSAPFKKLPDDLSKLRFCRQKYINGESHSIDNDFKFIKVNENKTVIHNGDDSKSPIDVYSFNEEYCFYHYNRFQSPMGLFIKENSIVEGFINNNLETNKLRNNMIRLCDFTTYPGLIYVDDISHNIMMRKFFS